MYVHSSKPQTQTRRTPPANHHARTGITLLTDRVSGLAESRRVLLPVGLFGGPYALGLVVSRGRIAKPQPELA